MFQIGSIKYTINKDNVHIQNSYKVSSDTVMRKYLISIKQKAKMDKNINYKRNINSWIKEWKAHNMLYIMGILKERTGSVDLNEDESKIKLSMYSLLAKLYDIYQDLL